jgi:hypothetical protein
MGETGPSHQIREARPVDSISPKLVRRWLASVPAPSE